MQKLRTQWNHKWGKHKRLKKLKNDVAKQNCNKTKAIEILLLMLLNIPSSSFVLKRNLYC